MTQAVLRSLNRLHPSFTLTSAQGVSLPRQVRRERFGEVPAGASRRLMPVLLEVTQWWSAPMVRLVATVCGTPLQWQSMQSRDGTPAAQVRQGRIAEVRLCSAKRRRAPLPNPGYGAPVQHRPRHLAGTRYAPSCFHEFYHPCYWVRSLAPVLYSLRAGLLEFVKGLQSSGRSRASSRANRSVSLARGECFLFDLIVVRR